MKSASLVLICDPKLRRVLLGRKKTGEMGRRLYNGPGGKIEPQDKGSSKACAIRETFKEWSLMLDAHRLLRVAILSTCMRGKLIMAVEVYTTSFYVGSPTETDDSEKPVWYDIDRLPLEEMHTEDRYWMPRVLKGEKLVVNTHWRPLESEPWARDCRPLRH